MNDRTGQEALWETKYNARLNVYTNDEERYRVQLAGVVDEISYGRVNRLYDIPKDDPSYDDIMETSYHLFVIFPYQETSILSMIGIVAGVCDRKEIVICCSGDYDQEAYENLTIYLGRIQYMTNVDFILSNPMDINDGVTYDEAIFLRDSFKGKFGPNIKFTGVITSNPTVMKDTAKKFGSHVVNLPAGKTSYIYRKMNGEDYEDLPKLIRGYILCEWYHQNHYTDTTVTLNDEDFDRFFVVMDDKNDPKFIEVYIHIDPINPTLFEDFITSYWIDVTETSLRTSIINIDQNKYTVYPFCSRDIRIFNYHKTMIMNLDALHRMIIRSNDVGYQIAANVYDGIKVEYVFLK